jgi:hypothetical protein
MANDVSYFKVPGDSTTYSFNDADAENKIGTLETTVASQGDSISTNATNIQTNRTAIGTLSSLTTDAKGNLVAAVNEVDSHVDANTTKIGATALPTTAQTVTGAVAEHEGDITTLNSSSLLRKDTVADGTNIAGMTLQGVYALSGNNAYTGMPTGVGYGTLIIYRPFTSANSNFIVQEIVTTGAKTYRRIRTNDSWSAWKCLDDEVSTLNSKLYNNIGTAVDLNSYTAGTYYTAPSDGYLAVDASASSAAAIFRLYGASTNLYVNVSISEQAIPCYVRKGMRIDILLKVGTVDVKFQPFA